MYRPQPPPMDPEEVEAIFASIDEKIQQSTPNNIAVKKSDVPEDDAVLSSLHKHLSTMIEDRDETLEDLVSRINILRSKLHEKQPDVEVTTDQSHLLTFKEVDALPREQRRKYLSYVPVKVIVDLDVEIEAKQSVLRMGRERPCDAELGGDAAAVESIGCVWILRGIPSRAIVQ